MANDAAASRNVYDAFLSHAHADADLAARLQTALQERGLRCLHHEYDFTPGFLIQQNILDGIHSSKCVLLVVTPAFLNSKWATFERNAAIMKSKISGLVTTIAVCENISPDAPDFPQALHSMPSFTYSSDDAQFWEALAQAIREPRRLEDVLGAGDVAHGLAQNYYYGYLKIVIPVLGERLYEWLPADDPSDPSDPPRHKRLVVVIPKSCEIKDLKHHGKEGHIRHVDPAIVVTSDKPVYSHREFRIEMYLLTDPRNPDKRCYVAMVGCAAVSHIREMNKSDSGRYSLTSDQVYTQRETLQWKLNELVKGGKMENKVDIVHLDDSADSTESLSELVMKLRL